VTRFLAPARPLGSFIQIAESKKCSELYRILSRKNIDNDIPGPPHQEAEICGFKKELWDKWAAQVFQGQV
jgi:hypothetical protein